MKQVVQDLRTGQTNVVDVPKPKPAEGLALVQTSASVLSAGTERMIVDFARQNLLGKARSRPDLVKRALQKARQEGIFSTWDSIRNQLDTPMPLGYASSGTIVEVGEDLQGFKVGDRVACGGGYAAHAEYCAVPALLMARIPDKVSFEEAAFTTLGAIALHGFRLSETHISEKVAVIGLGVLGQIAASIAKAAGCEVFGVDLDEHRVALAKGRGIDAVVREVAEDSAAAASEGFGFDTVLICADTDSADPIELAGEIARDHGSVILIGAVGTTLPRRTYYGKELRFQISRSYGPGRYDPVYEEAGIDYPMGYVRWTETRNFKAFLNMLAEGHISIKDLITHRFPIEQAPQAYQQLIQGGEEPYLGVLLTYLEREGVVREGQAYRFVEQDRRQETEIKLGVLGAGQFATAVGIPAAVKTTGATLIGIASQSGLSASQAGRRYGFEYAAADEQELYEDEGINTLAIFTRHHLHAKQTAAALQAGKHVFCEKPLAITIEGLTAVEDALKGAQGILTVGFNRRFAPLAIRLRHAFEVGGNPMTVLYRINAGPLPPDHWLNDPAQGGGRLLGEVCHFIDFLTFITGELPGTVRTVSGERPGSLAEENIILTLTYPGGSTGTLAYITDGDRAVPKERIEVFSGGQAAILDDFRRLEVYRAGRKTTTRSPLRQDKGHQAIWKAFVLAIEEGGSPPVPYNQVFAIAHTTFAAQRSLRENRTISLQPMAMEPSG